MTYLDGFNVPNYENRDPAPKFQLPFTADDAQKFMQTPAEFEVELFAQEPDIIKPITLSFDERGRLWVVEAMDYPNEVLDGNPGDDRIKILEDTNGDGRADKFTVFAEHLNLPTSLVFANGGVIVAAAPHILFLKDTNGDDKADVRQILSTGWGIRDTHAGPSNLQYAPDNHIWGVVGYSGFNGEMNGKPMQFTQGPYRFKPDGSEFEYMTTSTNNTWGLGFSETFDVFGSTANNDQSWYMAIPNRYFADVRGIAGRRSGGRGRRRRRLSERGGVLLGRTPTTPYIRQVDVWGGYTAAAGPLSLHGAIVPEGVLEPHRVHQRADGAPDWPGGHREAGRRLRHARRLEPGLERGGVVCAGAAQVGPDGAVWMADWYNFIAQHNPTPAGLQHRQGRAYETSMRDHSRGRIYRIVYKGAPAAKKRRCRRRTRPGLLERARGRQHVLAPARAAAARRAGTERRRAAAGRARAQSVGRCRLASTAGRCTRCGRCTASARSTAPTEGRVRAAVEALKHPAAGVRKAAAMVLPHTAEAGRAILQAGLLKDPDLHTRLSAVLALADMPASDEIGQALYAESQSRAELQRQVAGPCVLHRRARQQKSFTAAYHADRDALPYGSLPVSLRIGNTKPDWRTPAAAELGSEWKEMQVPGNWEARGLPDFDGVVWFTRYVEVGGRNLATTLTLGPVRNNAEVWVNGLSLTAQPVAAPQGAARDRCGRRTRCRGTSSTRRSASNGPDLYEIPTGALHAGANTITVRIQNTRNEGDSSARRSPSTSRPATRRSRLRARGGTASSARPTPVPSMRNRENSRHTWRSRWKAELQVPPARYCRRRYHRRLTSCCGSRWFRVR